MSKVEEYIEKHQKWSEALSIIRNVILETELEEQIKWGAPVYALNGKNVLGLAAFKNHFGIWFFQGVFLKDELNLLQNSNEKTKALRQMRFTSLEEINTNAIKSYVLEAIENQRQGREIKPSKVKKVVFSEELKLALKEDQSFNEAFQKLSMSKQNEYANHISEAKRNATKLSRIEKIKPLVLSGAGLHDKYKNC
ncbi:MAG: DUF1801 domain-containing protein [Flavobacteriales bacterium]|nr:DUF1801 domain-containing protein [Flavobacteriales bacterium]